MTDLRKKAEAALASGRAVRRASGTRGIPALRRELDLQHVELEMQNEELRRAKRELERAHDRYFELFEHAPIAYLTITRTGRIAEANAKACQLLGVPGDRLVRERLSSFVAPSDAALIDQHRKRVFDTRSESLEIDLLRPDGSPVSVRLESMVTGRTAASARVAILDLSEVKQAHLALFQSQKMEALGTLATGISHDFNNVLMALRGCVDMLDDALERDHSARLVIEEMKSCVEQGVAVTERLRTFSRKDTAAPVVFDLNDAVTSQVGLLRRLIGDDIEISLDLDARDARVKASEAEIQQVLMNLVVNARDAMVRHGRITIRTTDVRVGPAARREPDLPAGAYVMLTVQDTGCGIPEKLHARLFEPFFTTKESGKGTGLGLAIVHSAVTRAGGRIHVKSSPGQGATFEILLPKSDEQPSVRRADKRDIHAGGTETILLVEDEPLVRTTTRYQLERAGYRVLEAGSGAEALECSARFPGHIDLLLTDLSMPGRDGRDVARKVRATRKGIAVLVMSAHDVTGLAQRAPAAVLQKPFTAESLLSAVRSALDDAMPSSKPLPWSSDRLPELPPSSPMLSLAAASIQGRTVLVVDDNDSARVLLSTYLQRLGWDVVSASTATAALRAFREREAPPSVVVTDYLLPDKRGDDLVRELRALAPGLRALYVTGHEGVAGATSEDTVLLKPIDLPRLARELERVARADSDMPATPLPVSRVQRSSR
jgi:PAS domain S-box-containing protein